MDFIPHSTDRLLTIYLALGQYPILKTRIRAKMRQVLFTRGIIQPQAFEARVRDMAVRSQEREGLRNPYAEEPVEIWDVRMSKVRDQLTDLIFSHQLSFEDFEKIVSEVLGERGINQQEMVLSVNPELAPQELVFEQAMAIENLPEKERVKFEARLQESKVVLIRHLISDQLRYINIAKEWFKISDLAEIRQRKIGTGRIGGKAAGMLLAHRVLMETIDPADRGCLKVPESYFIGANEMYTFMNINNLVHWNDQKYKSEDEMRADYPEIVQEYQNGEFPPDIVQRLQTVVVKMGNKPMIVRSSSQLEDNFGTSFAGKYDSIFLPNQGTLEENMADLRRAIATIYASTLNPNALLYRRARGLQDYDERMALLIQEVQGETFGHYYLPHGAGVAFSRNLFRWAPQIRSEDGFVRLVWGLGTRAVDRVGNDYPRLIALSHPTLRPSTDARAIRYYSQQYVDVIDLQENEIKTLPIHELLDSHYPPLRYLAQSEEDGYFTSIRSNILQSDTKKLVITFEELIKRTRFAERMRSMLRILEKAYRLPVDVEFTIEVVEKTLGKPTVCFTILQCRPQSQMMPSERIVIPKHLDPESIIFDTHFVVPQGHIDQVDYVLYIRPSGYFSLKTNNDRTLLARTVGKVNAALKDEAFICIGPGRWGSSNADLGVPIAYGDIYNTKALVEMAGQNVGLPPEPSLGTHFFQDLLESNIFPLAIQLDDENTIFNQSFFNETANRVSDWVELPPELADCLKLIKISDFRRDHFMRILMSDEQSQAVAYLTTEENKL